MLGQTAESKMEKFIDTMPTMLDHIIRKCDPPAAVLPNLTKGTAISGLYSHIALSNDKEETDIPQPFKGV